MHSRTELIKRIDRARLYLACRSLAAILLAAAAGTCAGAIFLFAIPPLLPASARHWFAAFAVIAGLSCAAVLSVRQWRRSSPLVSRRMASALLAAGTGADTIMTGTDIALWGEGGAEKRGASAELAVAEIFQAETSAKRVEIPGIRVDDGVGRIASLAAFLFIGAVLLHWQFPARSMAGITAIKAALWPPEIFVSDLRVTIEPPPYTGIPATTVESRGEAFKALPGSALTIDGRLSSPVETGALRLSDGTEIPLVFMESAGAPAFRALLPVSRPVRAEARFLRKSREVPSNMKPFSVDLLADESPKVELLRPLAESLTIFTDSRVDVEFASSDDFGIGRAEIVLAGNAEIRIPVEIQPGKSVSASVGFRPVSHPELGGRAKMRVEVWDNDDVSGPKQALSKAIDITFIDTARLLSEMEKKAKELLRAMNEHYGHQEESEAANSDEIKRLQDEAREIMEQIKAFDEFMERMDSDPESFAKAAVSDMKKETQRAFEPFLNRAEKRDDVTRQTKKNMATVENLLKNIAMERALSKGESMSSLQRDLFDKIASGESADKLMPLLDQIQGMMNELASALSKNAPPLPDEMRNSNAMKNMPFDEMNKMLDKLREAIKAGGMDAAKKLAENILGMMNQLMASMGGAAGSAADEAHARVMREMNQLESEIREVIAEQENILKDTEELDRDEDGDKTGQPDKKQQPDTRQQQEQNDRIQRLLKTISEAAMRMEALGSVMHWRKSAGKKENFSRFLETRMRVHGAIAEIAGNLGRDMPAALSSAQALNGSFDDFHRETTQVLDEQDSAGRANEAKYYADGHNAIEKLLEELQKTRKQPRQSPMSPRQRQAAKELSAQESELSGKTGGLQRKLRSASERLSFLGGGAAEKAEAARSEMDSAAGGLEGGDMPGAAGSERGAIERLSEAAGELQKASMAMSMAMGGGGGKFRLFKPGQEGEGEGMGVKRGHVEIPAEAEMRELRGFRERVMKAMREGKYPKGYESEVESYYKRLIK
ncbi:MAG: DUF4175 family protein [Nitrospirae bacterium]|nr:DUF4175 family protein [Nitrospirota bacterium]